MKRYRKFHKRKAYDQYVIISRSLAEDLKVGKITQEEFDRRHEDLDYKFNHVR